MKCYARGRRSCWIDYFYFFYLCWGLGDQRGTCQNLVIPQGKMFVRGRYSFEVSIVLVILMEDLPWMILFDVNAFTILFMNHF